MALEGYLSGILTIFLISAIVVWLFGKIRLPSVVGFLATGVLLGPGGLSLVHDLHAIEVLAEIGVALLLFTVGLEFSVSKIVKMGKIVFVAGPVQVFLVTLVAGLMSYPFLHSVNIAIFVGFLVSLSSTAVVLKLLMESGEIHSPQGANATGILVFQDIAVIPMMLLTPLLAGQSSDGGEVMEVMGKIVVVILGLIVGAKWVVPRVLFETVKTRNKELFIIVVLVLSLGTAFLAHMAGISLVLGAFLAGVMISESEYSHMVVADIMPFRDSLNSLFFVSIGMLLDLQYVMENPATIIAFTLCIILVKIVAGSASALMLGNPLRLAVITGFFLSQIGEFSFILIQFGKSVGMDLGGVYQPLLAGAIITMAATPLMLKMGPIIGESLSKRFNINEPETESPFGHYEQVADHVIIIGFGPTGQNLARVLKKVGILYNILEMNPSTVRKFAEQGEPIHYGDAVREHVLSHVGIEKARVLVIAISDPTMERRIVPIARHMNSKLHIVARTRYQSEIEPLVALGASEVISEEFETSIEIFAHALRVFGVSRTEVGEQVESVRSSAYKILRSSREEGEAEAAPTYTALGAKFNTELHMLENSSAAVGQSLADVDLRSATGALVLAVERDGMMITSPPASFIFKTSDKVHLFGGSMQISAAVKLLDGD